LDWFSLGNDLTTKNKMNFKKLEKAQKYYQQVKRLDAEIIEIEKLAVLMAEGGKVGFEISCEPKVDEGKKKVLDGDGSLLVNGGGEDRYTFYLYGCDRPTVTIEKPKKNHIKCEVIDSVGLQLLGVLMAEKQSARKKLLTKLSKIQNEV
jgi:hypothetical protein